MTWTWGVRTCWWTTRLGVQRRFAAFRDGGWPLERTELQLLLIPLKLSSLTFHQRSKCDRAADYPAAASVTTCHHLQPTQGALLSHRTWTHAGPPERRHSGFHLMKEFKTKQLSFTFWKADVSQHHVTEETADLNKDGCHKSEAKIFWWVPPSWSKRLCSRVQGTKFSPIHPPAHLSIMMSPPPSISSITD